MKNQVEFKSNLKKIKIRSNKSEDQKNTVRNIIIFSNLREKIVILFKDHSFLLLKAKYKAK